MAPETSQSYPYIVRTLDVRGGRARECLAFYDDHRGEIDLLVAQQMAAAPDRQ